MYGYVYQTTNLINNKIYVGQHMNSTLELDESYLGSGNNLKKAIKKYGSNNFKCEILEWCDSKEKLDKQEIYWINELNATNPNLGYNMSPGGTGGYLGEESCLKMSLIKIGKPTWNTGKTNVYSKESLEKMSLAKKGKSTWNSNKKNIYSEESLKKMSLAKDNVKKKVLCIENNKIYKSSLDACKELNFDIKLKKKINRCCLGHLKNAFGYHWKYVEE